MLSRLSVKKPMTVFVCVVLVLILGVMSFINMTTDLLPNMDLPYAIAYTTYIGASPEQVEQSVTKTLESALATTSGVKNITSISQENVSIVVLEFEEGTGMDSAMIEMNASLDQIAGSLPEAAGSPVLMKINPDMLPIMVLAVDSDNMARNELSEFTSSTVIPALERVDGVASVSGSGLVESQIRVELDQAKIDELNDKVLVPLIAPWPMPKSSSRILAGRSTTPKRSWRSKAVPPMPSWWRPRSSWPMPRIRPPSAPPSPRRRSRPFRPCWPSTITW